MKEEPPLSRDTPPQPRVPLALSPRLQTVGRCIGAASYLIDVGTDHALLPLAWLEQHPRARALGIDQAQQPLEGAEQNRQRSAAAQRLDLRLQSGLADLHPPENSVLSICGMGGRSIQQILGDAIAVRQHQLSRMVLSPNDRPDVVRATLIELGWAICAEDALWDHGRFYPVISARKAKDQAQALDPLSLRFGPHLLANQHPALATWLVLQAQRLNKIQVRLAPKAPPKELVANLEELHAAWARYFEARHGALFNPRGLTVPPTTKHTK